MAGTIKLLTVIETLGQGGAERVLVNTLPALQKLGIECEVATLFDPDDLAKELDSEGIKVHRLHLSYKWNIIEGVFKLNQLLKNNRYDIVHAHLFFAIFYTGLLKVFFPLIKTVSTFHNLTFSLYPPNTLWKKIRIKIESLIVKKFIDRNTACSEAVAKHYKHFLSLSRVDVIYNGFSLETLNLFPNEILPNLSDYFSLQKPNLILVTPGRAHIQKGHHYLLEAIQLLNKDKLKIGFLFIGDGPEYENISVEIRSKKLEKWVTQLHAVEQRALFKIVLASDIVILPSISEGFPMVIGEAMSLGKPIIATKVSGIPELIDDRKEGLLVPAKNPVQLAKSIELMIQDSVLRNRMAENAKKKVADFDLQIITKQWKRYYEGMLNG